MEFTHVPVLKDEVIKALKIEADGLYLDGTLGGGGHSEEILKRLVGGRLIAIDQDEEAIDFAKKRLETYADKLKVVKGNFRNMKELMMPLGAFGFNGILLDIGVSSYQLDEGERGFTFREDSPLDMRMDKKQNLNAQVVLNEYAQDELTKIFLDYGEERYSRRIARKIVEERKLRPIKMSSDLVKIISESIPHEGKKSELKSIMRIFQAVRIEVNDELNALKDAIPQALDLLRPSGRLAIITFHSLEDRIVKQAFNYEALDCICDPSMPICTCDKKVTGKIINKKPIIASAIELKENPRAKSAKLRIIEKV